MFRLTLAQEGALCLLGELDAAAGMKPPLFMFSWGLRVNGERILIIFSSCIYSLFFDIMMGEKLRKSME